MRVFAQGDALLLRLDADEDLVEAAIFRAVRVGEAQVPLAEDAGRVSVLLKDIRQGGPIPMHDRPAGNGGENSGTHRVLTCQDHRATRGAIRWRVEVGEFDALFREAVDVRGHDLCVPVAAHFVVTLVVREDVDHVRGPCGGTVRSRKTQGQQEMEKPRIHPDK